MTGTQFIVLRVIVILALHAVGTTDSSCWFLSQHVHVLVSERFVIIFGQCSRIYTVRTMERSSDVKTMT